MKTKIFQTKKDIEKEMASYGDGTRMTIIVAWNDDKGHSFIAE